MNKNKPKIPFDRFKLAAGTLKTLLLTINGMEGLDQEYIVNDLRERLLDYKNYLGELPEFQDNKRFAKLDAVFTAAGWDDQGLRWTRESSDDPEEEVFIVHFTNKCHTTWELA